APPRPRRCARASTACGSSRAPSRRSRPASPELWALGSGLRAPGSARGSVDRVTDLTLLVPTQQLADDVRGLLDPSLDVDIAVWDDAAAPPRDRADIVVPPYMRQGRTLRAVAALEPRLVQGQAIGYDGVADVLPEGIVYANATSVHETATAELAVGLIVAAQRELPRFVRQQEHGDWSKDWAPGLADRRVVMLGYGGVGKAIAARLDG